uniref:Tryptophan-rich sensory protein n=1 Tax=Palpitomonas bilix TaxID=652834 RepID=A0A7S3GDU3_9EUKA|mmetsp:Transcript_45193/g.116941  ORF Transcript_45193/g.116941 Transcript_45193/m.116941 type:complete len:316 (+) Transcript_45193:47-994(+)
MEPERASSTSTVSESLKGAPKPGYFENKSVAALQIVNVLLFVVVFTVNSIGGAVGFDNRTVASVSDSLPNRIVPAGYAFLIWNLIYLLNLVFIIWQVLPSSQRNTKAVQRIGWLNPILSVVNTAWIFAWIYGVIWLSEVLIVAFLALLITIQIRIGTYVPGIVKPGKLSTPYRVPVVEVVCIHLFFSVYIGWLSVATAANTAATFVKYVGVGTTLGWTAEGWSVLIQVVILSLAIITLLFRRDGFMTLVFTWALVAVGQNQQDSALVSTSAYTIASIIGVLSLFALITGFIARSRLPTADEKENNRCKDRACFFV